MKSVIDESNAIFQEALDRGVLVYEPETAVNFVGNWMLMEVTANNSARFKNRDTREYLTMPDVAEVVFHFKPKRYASFNGVIGLFVVSLLVMNIAISPSEVLAQSAGEAATVAVDGRSTLDGLLSAPPTSESIPGFTGTSMDESGYDHDTLINAGQVPVDDMTEDARTNILNQPSWTLSPNTLGDLNNAINVQDNPGDVEDLNTFLSGEYEACNVQIAPSTQAGETLFCDRWPGHLAEECIRNRVVTYEQRQDWACSRTNSRTRKKCTRTLTKSCDRISTSSDAHDLIVNPSIVATASNPNGLDPIMDYRINGDGTFQIGRYAGGACTLEPWWNGNYITTLSFDVPNLNNIVNFRLLDLSYDDWMLIRVNGTTLYDDDGVGERDGGARSQSNIDLRHLLVEGRNSIYVKVTVGGCGHGYVLFRGDFRQCDVSADVWSETCER